VDPAMDPFRKSDPIDAGVPACAATPLYPSLYVPRSRFRSEDLEIFSIRWYGKFSVAIYL
jgi:hypothetical protein